MTLKCGKGEKEHFKIPYLKFWFVFCCCLHLPFFLDAWPWPTLNGLLLWRRGLCPSTWLKPRGRWAEGSHMLPGVSLIRSQTPFHLQLPFLALVPDLVFLCFAPQKTTTKKPTQTISKGWKEYLEMSWVTDNWPLLSSAEDGLIS